MESTEAAEKRLDMYGEEYHAESLWRGFREWVQQHKSESEHLMVKSLKAKPLPDITMCTTEIVAGCLRSLEVVLKDCGIMSEEGILLESECDRLICCDEKGFSQRSDSISRGVLARAQSKSTSAAAPEVTWGHITVCSFMPCAGPRLPCGVVVSTSRVLGALEPRWLSHDSAVQ